MRRSPIQRLRIQESGFAESPSLQVPLNAALASLQDQVAAATQGVVKLFPLPAIDVRIDSNTPGTTPWPIRLSQVAGAPLGVTLLRIENLTTPGSNGVPTSAVSVTSFRAEAGTVFVDFVSGLTLNSRYRMVFGVYDAS